jgi:hypothetical protein
MHKFDFIWGKSNLVKNSKEDKIFEGEIILKNIVETY